MYSQIKPDHNQKVFLASLRRYPKIFGKTDWFHKRTLFIGLAYIKRQGKNHSLSSTPLILFPGRAWETVEKEVFVFCFLSRLCLPRLFERES